MRHTEREKKSETNKNWKNAKSGNEAGKKNWATSHKTIYQRKLELLLSVQKTILFITIHVSTFSRPPSPLPHPLCVYDNKLDGRRTRELFLAERVYRGQTHTKKEAKILCCEFDNKNFWGFSFSFCGLPFFFLYLW